MAARYDSRDFASEANRWAGRNRAGYVNPRADALFDLIDQYRDEERSKGKEIPE